MFFDQNHAEYVVIKIAYYPFGHSPTLVHETMEYESLLHETMEYENRNLILCHDVSFLQENTKRAAGKWLSRLLTSYDFPRNKKNNLRMKFPSCRLVVHQITGVFRPIWSFIVHNI